MTTNDRRRIALEDAQAVACQLLDLLDPVTTLRQIVGSVRRRVETVGDLELLVEPLLVPVGYDLFGNVVAYRDELECWCRERLGDGTFTYRLDVNERRADGERYKRLAYQGIALDLFICRPPAQFGVLELIRTGDSQWSRLVVTQRGYGGLMPFGMSVSDGRLMRGDQPLDCPTEADVFREMGLGEIPPPHDRTEATAIAIRAGAL